MYFSQKYFTQKWHQRPLSRVITLKIWHPGCWTLDVTERLQGLKVVASSISSHPPHIVADAQVQGDGDLVARFIDWIDRDRRIVHSQKINFDSRRKVLRLFTKYELKDSVFSTLLSHDMLPMGPTWAQDGYEYWKVCTPTEGIASELLRDPRLSGCEVTTLSAHPYRSENRTKSTSDSLTPRQLDVSMRALEMGYYTWPRKVTAKGLADKLGLSTPTVLEHLRKSESKIVGRFLSDLLEDRETEGR